MPWKIVSAEDGSEHCVHKENPDGSVGEKLKCYPDKGDAEKYMKALYANAEDMAQAFLFTELAGDKAFDGMAAGAFTAFSGANVQVDPDDLPAIVEKTKAAIASTRTEGGEVVGLPIDEDAHNHAGGAGWIVDVSLDETKQKIRFVPRWTEIGLKLIKDNIRRFFSVSVDLVNKVILGGSLTNWPATRTKDGKILLRPIELSAQLFALPKEINMDEKSTVTLAVSDGETNKGDTNMAIETITPEPVAPEAASPTLLELLQTPEAVKELGRLADAKAMEFVKAEARKKSIVEFAATLVGGSKDSPYGLPVKADEVVAVLLSLPPAQAEAVQQLLAKTMQATVNFMESGGNHSEFNAHPHLPKVYQPSLKMWLEAGKDIKSFFAANVELGAAEDYNLSEYKEA